MESLWFNIEGAQHYRCGLCQKDHPITEASGLYVRVGNEVIAIISGDCFEKAKDAVRNVLPHSTVQIDAGGKLTV